MDLQTRCAELLRQTNMTQADLAEKTGLDRGDVSRLMNADSPRFTVRTILRVARAFSMTPKDFLHDVDEIPEKLQDEISWWIQQFADGEAAIRERDDLRRTLDATCQQTSEKITEIEHRHADALSRLRTSVEAATSAQRVAEDAARKVCNEADDAVRRADNEVRVLRVEVDRLRRQVEAGAQREAAFVRDLVTAREALATTQKALATSENQKIATGVLGALFGAGAGALLAQSSNDSDG